MTINPVDSPFEISITPVFTVGELSHTLKRCVEERFNHVRVRGEISGFKRHTSGHLYYALKDNDAVIDAVSWRGSYSQAPIALEDGLEIIASGRLTTYPGRSKYQLIVEHFEATGQGALLKVLEDRKQKLMAEGLFARERKKPIPSLPTTIGVVTSPTGAVIRDILHRISDRFPCHVLVWPVLVQGPGAAEQIAAAINGFNAFQSKPDLLIVARGGGSIEDLWAFNEEVVVRAAAASSIPLISAVGHETDTTLIDYAADLRAPTPTGAAELAVPVLMDLLSFTQERHHHLNRLMRTFLDHHHLKLNALHRSLPDPHRLLDHWQLRLEDWHERLHRGLPVICERNQHHLMSIYNQLRAPYALIDNGQLQLDNVIISLNRQISALLQHQEQLVEHTGQRLEQASFTKILNRGFCLATTASGKAILKVSDFPQHHPTTLTFADGSLSVIRTARAKPAPKQKPDIPTLF